MVGIARANGLVRWDIFVGMAVASRYSVRETSRGDMRGQIEKLRLDICGTRNHSTEQPVYLLLDNSNPHADRCPQRGPMGPIKGNTESFLCLLSSRCLFKVLMTNSSSPHRRTRVPAGWNAILLSTRIRHEARGTKSSVVSALLLPAKIIPDTDTQSSNSSWILSCFCGLRDTTPAWHSFTLDLPCSRLVYLSPEELPSHSAEIDSPRGI